jgi:FtsP/CotA-like multicopper oxidase with cupredoxin domain
MDNQALNRRTFLKYGLVGLGGTFFGIPTGIASAMMGGGMMGRGMGMMMTGMGSVIDPPPGGNLRDPVAIDNISAKPGVVEVALDAKWAYVPLDGGQANLLTYNGLFPGPTIRIRKGDLLRIHFRNSMPRTGSRTLCDADRDLTNVHTHGLHVSPSGIADNVMRQYAPGESFTHEYDTSQQRAGAFCFYHPHIHGSVAEQVWAGLAGALIVEDPTQALDRYETHVLLLKDIGFSGGGVDPYSPMDFMMGKEGSVVMVNGQINPVLAVKPGQVQRWRIVNPGPARFYNLSIENHTMYLIGTDGGLLDRPYPLPRVLVAPGERIDVLVKANVQAGRSRLLSLPYNRGGCCCGQSQTVTLMTMDSQGEPIKDEIPSIIDGEARRPAMDYSRLQYRRMFLGMGMGQGFINGKTFGNDSFSIQSRLGTYEIWEFVNTTHMDHPMHQHVNAAMVLGIRGGDPDYSALYAGIPAWKDTVIVPKMGSATLLMPVLDYTGMAMMHCHILEHEDTGMLGIWNIE